MIKYHDQQKHFRFRRVKYRHSKVAMVWNKRIVPLRKNKTKKIRTHVLKKIILKYVLIPIIGTYYDKCGVYILISYILT